MKVGVIGSGTMGNGIAHSFASNGYDVLLHDINDELLSKGLETIKKNFLSLCDKYKKDEILKLFVDENNNIGNSQTYYPYEKKIITYKHNGFIVVQRPPSGGGS